MAVTVQITNPNANQTVNLANISVQATVTTDAAGATITGGTVTINGGTPFALVYDAALGKWKKFVAIPQGAVTAVVTAQDSVGGSGTDTVHFSNSSGPVVYAPPSIAITFPSEGDIFGVPGLTATADVGSAIGIDPTSVQISLDAVNWITMAAPPPGGGGQ